MDNLILDKSETSIKKDHKVEDHSENNSEKNHEKGMVRIELKNTIKKISYACYLIMFILGIMISVIYVFVKIQNALVVFDDIYSNWQNNFIEEVYEKQAGVPCNSKSQSANLFTYTFRGARKGCYCEDCGDKNMYSISGLIGGQDLKYEYSTGEYNDFDADVNSRRRRLKKLKQKNQIRRRRRRLSNLLITTVTQTEYSDFDVTQLEDVLDFKIVTKSCDEVSSLDEDDFYTNISAVQSSQITSLITDNNSEINLCITRSQTNNFFTSHYRKGKKCSSNQILCKGLNETNQSFWFCIDSGQKCPIREIHIVLTSEVSKTNYPYDELLNLPTGYSVLISRTAPNVMPISEINIFESEGPCINKNVWRLSSQNVLFNPLLYQLQSYQCSVDVRYTGIGFQINQKTLYKQFSITSQMLQSNYPLFFLPQQNITYDVFYRNYIQFDISCRGFLSDVQNLSSSIKKLERITVSVITTSSILCFLQLIDIVFIIKIVWRKNESEPYPWRQNKIGTIIYSLFKYPVALSVCILDFILFYSMVGSREIGQDIINRNCTDSITSSQFKYMTNTLSFYGIFFHVILLFCFWSADIHFMNLVRKYCLMKQKKLTPFDEFFSLPKQANQYDKISKVENDDGVSNQEKANQNQANNKPDNIFLQQLKDDKPENKKYGLFDLHQVQNKENIPKISIQMAETHPKDNEQEVQSNSLFLENQQNKNNNINTNINNNNELIKLDEDNDSFDE